MSELRIIISGGGTGGHIFPAIAIANAIKKLKPGAEILFVGANDKMEMEKVPAAGYRIIGLTISGFSRSLSLKNLTFPFKLLFSLLKSLKIIRQFSPDVVVGVGGFASGPVLYAAQKKGIPTVIQEQNSFAGVTNRILGKHAQRICVAYDGMERFFPAALMIRTGNPVRQDILDLTDKRKSGYEQFDLDPALRTLLIIGGSLGARSINHAVVDSIEIMAGSDIQVLWQTGKQFAEEARSVVHSAKADRVHVFDFIKNMDLAYAVSDVVMSRAGASSISELCIVGKPAVLIPFPFAAEDHQTKNAMALVNCDAAILIPDEKAKDDACSTALGLIRDEKRCLSLSENIRKMALPNADRQIATEILKLASAA